jgi:hypothetical protein
MKGNYSRKFDENQGIRQGDNMACNSWALPAAKQTSSATVGVPQ